MQRGVRQPSLYPQDTIVTAASRAAESWVLGRVYCSLFGRGAEAAEIVGGLSHVTARGVDAHRNPAPARASHPTGSARRGRRG